MSFSSSRRRALKSAAALAVGSALPFRPVVAAEPHAKVRDLESRFAADLDRIAAKCEELGLVAEAATTRGWAVVPRSDQTFLYLPDEDVLPPEEGRSEASKFWRRRFLEARADFAAKVFALAVDAAGGLLWSDRFRLLWRVLREDPTHADARRILAIEPAGDGGLPAIERVRVSEGRFEYPDIGWRARAWTKCESDRFELSTNASPESGRRLARRLERYRLIWLQLFPERWLGQAEFEKAIGQGHFLRYPDDRHRVALFATREAYVAYLTRYVPRAAESMGVYSDQKQVSYFYNLDDGPDASTVIHELGHQLFQEIGTVADEIGRAANFWVIEGIATYLESHRSEGSRQILGGVASRRMQNARYRLRHAGQLVPIDEFAAMAYSEYSTRDDLSFVYSQGAGLSHYFLHGVSDAARDGFFKYIDDVYVDRDPPDALFRRTGMTPEEIREGYLAFLDVTDDDLAAVNDAEALASENLCLAQTSVTDRAMTDVARFANVEWLDLAGAKITAAGARRIGALRKLVTLDLQGVGVDAGAIEAVAALPALEELILSDTAIDDESLALLERTETLTTISLNRTSVSAAAVEKLVAALPKLTTLNLVGTSFDAETAKKLEASKPGLSATVE